MKFQSTLKKLIIIIAIGFIFLLTKLYIFDRNETLPSDTSHTYITEIKKEDLENLINTNSTCWVYVGRPSCPDCQKFYPKLEEFVNSNKLDIYYYNTQCKASQKQSVREYYNSLGVNTVPSIMQIIDGKIVRIYDTQNEEDISNFETNMLL